MASVDYMTMLEACPSEVKVAVGILAAVVVILLWTVLMSKPTEDKVVPVILGMATGNPPYRASQQQALAIAEKCPDCTSIRPVLNRIYGNSRINYRYMAVPDFTPEQKLEGDENFFDSDMMFKMPVRKALQALALLCSTFPHLSPETGMS